MTTGTFAVTELELRAVFKQKCAPQAPGAAGSDADGSTSAGSLSFHRGGVMLVGATDSGRNLTLVDTSTGRERKSVFSKKDPIGLVQYTHHEQTVLCSTRPSSGARPNDPLAHAVRYLSLYDNKYLRYYQGHTDTVTSLAMSPANDYFLTTSNDRSMRLWALPNTRCLASLPIDTMELGPNVGAPLATYDRMGMVFAVACAVGNTHVVNLYDAREYQRGSFQTFTSFGPEHMTPFLASKLGCSEADAAPLSGARWTCLEFSPNGESMLAATDMGIIILFDAFSGALQHAYTGHNNTSRRPLQACITPDNKHVVTGSEDGEVFVYDIATEKVKKKLSGHVAPVRSVACSTKFEVLASACENIGLWSRGN